ncbi:MULTISPECIES: response regulator transcription factor [Synechocystis]|uniref:Response regulator n=1 Tax=Synechocystis salina LEGE 00031 TaxID=1828736 RepID=A0ABR9VW90_9SYNC|nr:MULTISPECIES: response regulator [Synechocystis]MBD2655117.1 response regulator [Synechocystis sp. FACHB-383]MBE9195274.1 response regulator [Synechocystis sp. LEGE 06083]MBE9241898.1 response regulator [Synechocystis salina LEGE 00041]MBE9255153.1 response regulator [Synechocystis salina LEGE 00031]QUS60948.1 response regulator [Synechocystis sp. PCC 7338]
MGSALIIDDSSTERSIISDFCQKLGINVTTAISGEEALEKLSQAVPDVIILDIVLPGRSGFEICRELKDKDQTKSIPVILCSTKATDMDKFWGKRQGADAYITKPIDQEEFNTVIKQFI